MSIPLAPPKVLGFFIDGSFVRLAPGITVLYGLNGAGKTRTLEDVRNFYEGRLSPALALIQLPEGRALSAGPWADDWARGTAHEDGELEPEDARTWVERSMYAMDPEPETPFSVEPKPDRVERLIDEWLVNRVVLVRSLGGAEHRMWASVPAFLSGEGLPYTTAEVAMLEYIWGGERYDGDTGGLCLSIEGVLDDGRTVCSTALSGMPALQTNLRTEHHSRPELTPELRRPVGVDDVDDHTQFHLHARFPEPLESKDGLIHPIDGFYEYVRWLEVEVNAVYSSSLQDAPTLRLHVSPGTFDRTVEWFVAADNWTPDPPHDPLAVDLYARGRTLRALSLAQLRWALWAIEVTLSEAATAANATVPLVILDEPEAALHRSAEGQMAAFLARYSEDDRHVWVATHSPELLDLPTSAVHQVERVKGGWRAIRLLTSPTRANMEELGLTPSDLLRRQRGLVLVEGNHDQVILEKLFGEQFGRLRVDVLPLRGAYELSAAKISFLFDYTPAHVFVVLDNIHTSALATTWEKAYDLQVMRQHDQVQALLDEAECFREQGRVSPEGKILRELLQATVEQDRADRLTPHGLSKKDIIEYVPVAALVPGKDSWSDLREQHQLARAGKRSVPKDFKRWLELDHNATFTPEALRHAVGLMDSVPHDMLQLLKAVEAHIAK